jgi:hypothetical protein
LKGEERRSMEQSTEALTLFGRMVEELLEEAGVEDLADLEPRLDSKTRVAIERRMRTKGYPVGDLGPFADLFGLSELEKVRLA